MRVDEIVGLGGIHRMRNFVGMRHHPGLGRQRREQRHGQLRKADPLARPRLESEGVFDGDEVQSHGVPVFAPAFTSCRARVCVIDCAHAFVERSRTW